MIQERAIDFNRLRTMRCGSCGQVFKLNCVRLENWYLGNEVCPECGLDGTKTESVGPYIDENDPVLNDAQLPLVYWYHSSLNPNWPDGDLDPVEQLTPQMVDLMGGQAVADAWAARQRNKALHLGTFEAAVHNVFRRVDHLDEAGKPFYLFRVRLRADALIRARWQYEEFNWAGDVDRDDICPRPVEVTRYLNETEDPGSFSLAVRPEAIASTQRICINELQVASKEIDRAVARLERACKLPADTENVFCGIRFPARPPLIKEAASIIQDFETDFPCFLRFGPRVADKVTVLGFEDWAQYVLSMRKAVLNPSVVLSALDGSHIRKYVNDRFKPSLGKGESE